MPWCVDNEMDQRLKFIAEASAPGAIFSQICAKYSISRTLGYKILKRYHENGIEGITPYSRKPKTSPNQIPNDIVCEIVSLRIKHPSWGGDKIRERILSNFDSAPSVRTVERIISKSGLVTKRRRKKRDKHFSTDQIVKPRKLNQVWTVDFKGEWRMKNGKYCYPLTIRDEYSKYILDIAALDGTKYETTKERFELCFSKYGLPDYIRSDNGTPFAHVRSVQGISKLSAWWIKQGIIPNRIPPASPHLNGAHERMHKDMKNELQIKPLRTLKQEQERFDNWRQEYNEIRPHAALKNKTPASKYKKSKRAFCNYEDFSYPKNYELRKVCGRGMITWNSKRHFISNSLAGEILGLEETEYEKLKLWYCEFQLGITDVKFLSPLGGTT